MSTPPAYTEYHPRWYRPRISTYWWLERWPYLAFILRELSSLFVAWAVVYLLLLVRAVARGASSYRQFLDWSASPLVLVLNLVTLAFLTFHAVTWFNLAPQAMVVHMGKKPVPAAWVVAGNYLAWFVATAVVAIVLLWG